MATYTATLAPKPVSSCCSSEVAYEKDNREAVIIDLIKKVARIAVLALALYLMPIPTLIGFSIGLIGGATAVLLFGDKLKKGDLMQLCILGYTEFASDTKFPALFNTCLTALFLFDCLSHGSPYFCGFISGGVGFWIGKEVTFYLKEQLTNRFGDFFEVLV